VCLRAAPEKLRSNLQRANIVIKLIVHLPAGETLHLKALQLCIITYKVGRRAGGLGLILNNGARSRDSPGAGFCEICVYLR
jgi:hypothetical protein